MPDPLGYNEWPDTNLLQHPPASGLFHPVIDGTELDCSIFPISLSAAPRGGLLPAASGTGAHQSVWVRAQQPINASPRSASFTVLATSRDVWAFFLALQGRLASFYLSWWEEDRWLVLGAEGAQEAWQLSREVAWANVTGVTPTTHVGEAFLDAAVWTIDYTPTPSDPTVIANAYLLDRDNTVGEPDAIQTRKQSDIIAATPGAKELRFRYPAIHRFRVERVGYTVQQANSLTFQVDLSELLIGTYTPIDPGPDIILDASAL